MSVPGLHTAVKERHDQPLTVGTALTPQGITNQVFTLAKRACLLLHEVGLPLLLLQLSRSLLPPSSAHAAALQARLPSAKQAAWCSSLCPAPPNFTLPGAQISQ